MSKAHPWLEPPWPDAELPRDMLEDRIQQILASTNTCVLATINAKGLPIASPIEYYSDGMDLYCLPDPGTPKLKAMQRDPNLCVAINSPYHGWASGRGIQLFSKAEIIEPHAPGWDHAMEIFHWRPWMEDIGLDASKPFDRQVAKITPYKILLTDVWLWKQGYSAKQKWLAET